MRTQQKKDTSTLRRKTAMTAEENWAINNSRPVGNKYVEAAIRFSGHMKVYDPKFM